MIRYGVVLLLLVPALVAGCKTSTLGKEYTGTRSYTKSGLTCQRWDSQSPHKHTNTEDAKFPDVSVVAAANYCRNPDGEPNGPWCYTNNAAKRWEYCDIKVCSALRPSPRPNNFEIMLTCYSTFSELQGPGPFHVICPMYRSCKNKGEVMGTNHYTEDSAICRSAFHALPVGRQTLSLGVALTIDVLGQRTAFSGTQQNGIISKSYTGRTNAYQFFYMEATCDSQLRKMLPGSDTQTLMFTCPNACNGGSVRGSPRAYTDDSSLCRSAVQVLGTDALAEGKLLIVRRTGIQSNFQQSTQNGVQSTSYSKDWRAYTFVTDEVRNPIGPSVRIVDCDATVKTTFPGMAGTIRVMCPTGNTCLNQGKVWGGPEKYTYDSKLCRSAIQMYGSMNKPNIVTINILGGAYETFTGVNQNGVVSLTLRKAFKAYRFTSQDAIATGPTSTTN